MPQHPRRPSRRPLAALYHDGSSWHGAALRFEGDNFRCAGTKSVRQPDAESIPAELLRWAAGNRCRRARIFLPMEIHELNLRMPHDAAPEEIQTAAAHELAPTLHLAAADLRVATVRTTTYRLGGGSDMYLAAGMDVRLVETFAAACAACGLTLEGVGPLELAALARHARTASNRGLLLVYGKSAFAVAPETAGNQIFIRNVPLGHVDAEADPERWREGVDRRLSRLTGTTIHLLTSHGAPERIASLLDESLACQVAESAQLDEIAPMIMRHAAWARVDATGDGCALGSRPKPPPNYRLRANVFAGALVFLVMLACAGGEVFTGSLLTGLRARTAAASNGARTAAAAEERLREARAAIAAERALATRIAPAGRIDPVLLSVLRELPAAIPAEAHITELTHDSTGLHLAGRATDSAAPVRLRRALDAAGARHGWRVRETMLSTRDDGEFDFGFVLTREPRQ